VVVDAQGSPVVRVVGFVTRAANRMRGGAGSPFTTDQFGRFDVRDLAPGNLLSASKSPDRHAPAPARPMELANVTLTITGSDIENLIVRTAPETSLRGQLEFDRPPAESASLRVSVTIGNPDGTCVERSSVTTFADDNHAFEVGSLLTRPTASPTATASRSSSRLIPRQSTAPSWTTATRRSPTAKPERHTFRRAQPPGDGVRGRRGRDAYC
jgi:hypothetical protein